MAAELIQPKRLAISSPSSGDRPIAVASGTLIPCGPTSFKDYRRIFPSHNNTKRIGWFDTSGLPDKHPTYLLKTPIKGHTPPRC